MSVHRDRTSMRVCGAALRGGSRAFARLFVLGFGRAKRGCRAEAPPHIGARCLSVLSRVSCPGGLSFFNCVGAFLQVVHECSCTPRITGERSRNPGLAMFLDQR